MQEQLSNRMTSVEQVVAEAAANVQRAQASEQTAWQAQLASELTAGKADAAAEAAAMGLVEQSKNVLKQEKSKLNLNDQRNQCSLCCLDRLYHLYRHSQCGRCHLYARSLLQAN